MLCGAKTATATSDFESISVGIASCKYLHSVELEKLCMSPRLMMKRRHGDASTRHWLTSYAAWLPDALSCFAHARHQLLPVFLHSQQSTSSILHHSSSLTINGLACQKALNNIESFRLHIHTGLEFLGRTTVTLLNLIIPELAPDIVAQHPTKLLLPGLLAIRMQGRSLSCMPSL